MAKLRVNVKFLAIVAGSIGGAAALLGGAGYFFNLLHENPKRFVIIGDRMMKEGTPSGYAEAIRQYQQAALKAKNDHQEESRILVRLGDAMHEMTRYDNNFIRQDLAQYVRALTEDPSNTNALQKLMAGDIEAIEFSPSAQSFQSLRDTADKILALTPSDSELVHKAEVYRHIAPIAGWLHGIETPDEELDDPKDGHITALARLVLQDAGNPDVPYYLALAYINRATEQRRLGHIDKANDLFRKAVTVFEDAIKGREDNSVLLLRFYDVLQTANLKTLNDEDVPDDLRYVPRMEQALKMAKAAVDAHEKAYNDARAGDKPTDLKPDSAFVDAYVRYGDFESRHDHRDEAEKALRDVVKARPENQTARLQLANLLNQDSGRRQEAIRLLQLPITDPGLPGIGAFRNRAQLEAETDYVLTNFLIEQYQSETDPAKKADAMAEVKETFQRLADRLGLDPRVLRLEGKIELLKPGAEAAIPAIQTLDRARALEAQQSPDYKDWDLTWLLARAYEQANQTGKAKEYLYTMLLDGAVPNFIPARLMLTQLLLADNEIEAAGDQVNILKRIASDNPDVKKLELQYLEMTKPNDPEIKNFVHQIIGPRTGGTKLEMLTRVRALMMIDELDNAVTTLESMRKQTPSDSDVVQLLVQIYSRQGLKPKAAAVIDEAVRKDPKNATLAIVKLKFDGAAPQKIQAAERVAIGEIADNLTREMRLFDFEMSAGNTAAAMQHLDAAEKIKPDDTHVLDLRFQFMLQAQKWDEASQYAQKLAEINADQAQGNIYRFRLIMAQAQSTRDPSERDRLFTDAGQVARQLVHDLPEFSRSHLCLAQQKQATGQFEAAEQEYETALQEQSGNIDAMKGIIECYFAMSQPEDAKRYIDHGLANNPTSPYFQDQIILYYLNYGDPRKAVPLRKAQLDGNKTAADAWLNLGAAYFQVAQVATKENKADEAKQAIADARGIFTQGVGQWPDDRLFYAYLSDLATFSNDFDDGEPPLKQFAAREKWKDRPEPWLMLGDYYQHFGKRAQAEAALLTARDKSNNSPDEQMKLAGFYIQQAQADKTMYDKAIGVLDPDSKDPGVQQELVETLVLVRKLDAAEKLLQKLVAQRPNDASLLAVQGFVLLNKGNTAGALNSLNHCLEVDPRNQTALFYRGSIYLHQIPPDADNAAKDLMASRDLNPKNVEVRMALADALRQKGDVDEAARELEQAVTLLPGSKDLRMKLVETYSAQTPPSWLDAEHALRDAENVEAWKKDPDWPRVEASMWVVRNQYSKALTKIRQAIALSPPDNFPLIQDYLNILQLAKDWTTLDAECTALLENKQVSDNEWWVFQARAVARRYEDQKDLAMRDYDTALNIASVHQNEDAVAMIVQSIKNTIGVDAALDRVLPRVAQGDQHWAVIAAYLYLDKGDNTHAVALIEKVLAETDKLTGPVRDTARDVAGSIYIAAQEYDKAVLLYQSILDHSPDDLAANNNMACLLSELVTPIQPQKAKVYSDKAMAYMQSHNMSEPSIMDTHGWILVQCGQLDDGLALIQQSIAKRPLIEAYYHLGEVYLQKNSPQEAVTNLQKAKELIADHKAKHQQVDTALETKVDDAILKAQQSAQQAATP